MAADQVKREKPKANIKVFGVGGGGNNVLLRMSQDLNLDIDLIAVNTGTKDLEYLAKQAPTIQCIQIGEKLTRGLGTGGRVELGEQAAVDAKRQLEEAMSGADMIFITAGMGGGTGTGAAPVISEIAREVGVLSIGVVTVPFSFEGPRKKRTALAGIQKMQANMDALIAVENDNLLKLPENRRMTLTQGFKCADQVLMQGINCIAELILTAGAVNVDFADLTTILRQSDSSDALLGIGFSNKSALEAVKMAASSPLIDKGLKGARGVIINLTGDNESLTMFGVAEAMSYIQESTDPNVNVIMGTVIDDSMAGRMKAMLIATDFVDSPVLRSSQPQQPAASQRPAAPQRPRQQELNAPSFMNHGAQRPTQQSAPARPANKPDKPAGGFTIPTFHYTNNQ